MVRRRKCEAHRSWISTCLLTCAINHGLGFVSQLLPLQGFGVVMNGHVRFDLI
jgi:hypothetical protein